MADGTTTTWYVTGSAVYNTEAAKSSSTQNKILSFSELPIGWYFGEGEPVSESNRDKALELLDHLHILGLTLTDAFPDQEGGILVTAYRGQHCFEFYFEANGDQHVVHESDGDEIWASAGEVKKLIRDRLREVFNPTCTSSDLFTQNIMTLSEGASSAWHFETHQTTAVPRSLTPPVWMQNTA